MIDAITYALLKGDIGQGTQEAVTEYLDEHLTNPSNPPIDTSLEIAGAAADAKATGDKISELKEEFTDKVGNAPYINGNISINLLGADNWIQGALSSSDGKLSYGNTTRISTGFIPTDGATSITVSTDSAYNHRCVFYDKTGIFIYTEEQYRWQNGSFVYPVPNNAYMFRLCVKPVSSGVNITPTDDTGTTYSLSAAYRAANTWNLHGEKISILGDSVTSFGGTVDDNNDNRYSQSGNPYTYSGNKCRYPQLNLVTQVGETFWMKLIKYFGFILGINESWAGSCVAWDGTSATGGYAKDNCLSSQTRINHLGENGSPDIILVNGGTNDIGQGRTIGSFDTTNPMNYTTEQIANLDVTTFANAYRAMLIRLQKTYPNAIIIVMLPNYSSNYYTPTDADAYIEIVKEACDYFGVLYVDSRTSGITIFNRASYLPDGVHYNSAGMERLYTVAKNAIERNYC